MSLHSTIVDDLKEAMKSKDAKRLSLLRQLKAALQNEAIEQGVEVLPDGDIIKIIKREVKRRKESIQEYAAAGRDDLVAVEETELNYLEGYLPQQMSEEEVSQALSRLFEGKELVPSDFGKYMSEAVKELGENADGSMISRLLKNMIS